MITKTQETFKEMVERCRSLPPEVRKTELRKWLMANPSAVQRALRVFQCDTKD